MSHEDLNTKVLKLENEIRKSLESTSMMSKIRFHHGKYFSMRYKPFNNQRVRGMIDNCCKEVIHEIQQKHPEIKKAEREYNGKFYTEILTISQTKNQLPIMYGILLDLQNALNRYLSHNKNRQVINSFKRLIKKRCKEY